MQGLHHQQQQLAALLAAGLPEDESSDSDDSRISAINSLHHAIIHPHNLLLVARSSSFLSQGLSQLLSDKSYSVRRAAVTAYGSLCSVVCSPQMSSNGLQSPTVSGGLAERFMAWALPQFRDISIDNGAAAELAFEGLLEFFGSGEAGGIELYVLPTLKACQELLEDERTSLNLLRKLLGLLTIVSVKFSRSFQSHFIDIVDLLLGWALVPDLSESDRCIIMGTFLQFQKHWSVNSQFSLGLLAKFLGDMEVVLLDGTPVTPQQFRRLLALLSCFLTVLQATASGMLEMNLLAKICEPLQSMSPQLLSCLSMMGEKFGWSKWVKESCRCLMLLADILRERFSNFYILVVDILFQNLRENNGHSEEFHKVPLFQVHGVLKANLQLMSLQKLCLPPSAVKKLLCFDSPLSRLRLHPSHLVTGIIAATYLLLLQHGCRGVVDQALASLMEELNLLQSVLEKNLNCCDQFIHGYSELELLALIKFDLKILLSSVCLNAPGGLLSQVEVVRSKHERSVKLASFIFEKLDPFRAPFQSFLDLQVHTLSVLRKLSEVEFLSKHTLNQQSRKTGTSNEIGSDFHSVVTFKKEISFEIVGYLRKYSGYIVRALHSMSPLTVKLEAFEWLRSFCGAVMAVLSDANMNPSFNQTDSFYKASWQASIGSDFLSSILDAASDREVKVRSQVASILELLLQARLISPECFYSVAELALEKLGDPNIDTKTAFLRVISLFLPMAIYTCGCLEDKVRNSFSPAPSNFRLRSRCHWHWKLIFALKQLPHQLTSQQFVTILSYVCQRWKVPLSNWILRLLFSSLKSSKDSFSGQLEDSGKLGHDGILMNVKLESKMLEKICLANCLAAAWWSIHEAARHCITVRLRTHLGGPTQTFAALERMLLDIAHNLKLDTEPGEGGIIIGSPTVHLLPMRLLLDFVEALKKNTYNAYEGSYVMPSASLQSELFFRANKKVCEEWFSRMCEPMMNAGLALQCHSAVLHYSSSRLLDLRNVVVSSLKDKPRAQLTEILHSLRAKIGGDVLRVLRHLALSMCRCREPDALAGLQKWAVATFFSVLLDDTQHGSGPTGSFGPFSWITGLIYQAHGQYEKAAAHFSVLLQSEEALSSMGSDGVQFIIARALECFTALSDWKSLEAWLMELQALRARHAGKGYCGALTTAGNEINAIHALSRFDEGDIHGSWSYLDLTPKSSNELTVDPKQALHRSEQLLLQAMLYKDVNEVKMAEEIEKAKLMLDEPLSVLSLDGLPEAVGYAVQLHCIYAFEEGCKHLSIPIGSNPKQLPAMMSSLYQVVHYPINKVYEDCSLWIKILRVFRSVSPNSELTLKLFQQLITLARKQRNFMLAHRLLENLTSNLSVDANGALEGLFITNLQYERILLMNAEEKYEDAVRSLWSLLCPYILSPGNVVSDSNNVMKAKACLKLSSWLLEKDPKINWENIYLKIREDYQSFRVTGISDSEGTGLSDTNSSLFLEDIAGAATKLSSILCPTMGKSWLSYASWCYNRAKKYLSADDRVLESCTLLPTLLPEISLDQSGLTEEEVTKVNAIVRNLLLSSRVRKETNIVDEEVIVWADTEPPLENGKDVKGLVQKAIHLIQTAAGAPGSESISCESLPSMLSSQLQQAFLTANIGIEHSYVLSSVRELVNIFFSVRRRKVLLFGHAAHGYLQYLSHSTSKFHEDGYSDGLHLDLTKQKQESCCLRATLYVLHVLLNYGVELRDMLEHGLATVPPLPWQEITPQLFARLSSHPEQVVRKQLEGLLMTLAKLTPWSIVYPTLVDINAYEGEPSEELQRILGCLDKLHPELVKDVQMVINGLGMLTVLWEEQWLSTLQDLHTDVIRRVSLLKEEAARVAENATLSVSEKAKINAAKYSAMMAPVIVAVERRLASTSRTPDTPHEVWFQKEYGEQLKSAIATFKRPPISTAALGDVWRPFDAIAASLATHQKRSSLSLSDAAPQLAHLSSSNVPMPGLEKQISLYGSDGDQRAELHGIVTISSFCEQVTILSTKTKPKKLGLIGSDGQKYTYLLKGREDLRLDARIMQLLQAINGFLSSGSNIRARLLAVRYYSVTPISGRAGLIQWVDDVVSIYSVFKSWQSRIQLAQMANSSNLGNTIPPVPRPSDMFYGKIIPALKEKGIRRVISRRDWPHEVKRKVLVDLMKETPRQLLYREIWCASEGFKAFSSKLKRFSGSVAAMSMVGHILGLGDRHLDNILMDFSTGDVVHIDYNVCFDKGQRLKIPEIVPFRLTQTMEAALGLTGIEGTFRANCESVIGVLRKNKDIILMLLEVFVWDPLVEWTRGDGHDEATIGGEERKGMELAVSLSLFASRVQEIRVPLQEHHDLLLATIPAAESALERFAEVINKYEIASAFFYHADQERSSLLLHEASAKSVVAEATCNTEKTRATFEVQAREFAQAKAVAAENAQEAGLWVDHHGRVIDALRSGSIPDLQESLRLSSSGEALSLISAVQVAGVPLTVVPEPTLAHCSEIDGEIAQLSAEWDDGFHCAVNSLQAYAVALQRILPLNYVTTSKVHSWAQLLQVSVNNLSSDVLALTRRQAADLIAKAKGDSTFDSSVHQRYEAICIKMDKYVKEIKKVREECSELEESIESETETKSKDRLLSAFTKYMPPTNQLRRDEDVSGLVLVQSKHNDETKDPQMVAVEIEEKRAKVLSVLHIAAREMYIEVKEKLLGLPSTITERPFIVSGEDGLHHNSKISFSELEEQIEKCVLVAGVVNEVQHFSGLKFPRRGFDYPLDGNWASGFRTSILACRSLIDQMIDSVLPDLIRSVISYDTAVMDAFGFLSQIRGSVDTAVEQLIEVELEKMSLMDLEENYFVKVGLITEQQLALEEAAVKGRDNLSWEEAEELATQEEACRAQLDQLHQTWNQKDAHASSLTRRETQLRNSLNLSEKRFSSLTNFEQGGDMHVMRSNILLAALANSFSELESIDRMLSSFGTGESYSKTKPLSQAELVRSGYSLTDLIWKDVHLLKEHSFFVWRIGIIDSFFDSCIHDLTASADHNLGFDQLYSAQKKKLELKLQAHLDCYLRERVVPVLLDTLDKESEYLQLTIPETKDVGPNQPRREIGTVKRAHAMFEEYCNAHETARAAKAAVSLMKRRLRELSLNLQKACLEAVQLEWLHDLGLPYVQETRLILSGFLDDNSLSPMILELKRHKILEDIQVGMSSLARATDSLQACERTAGSAEEPLERAMGWACGGPSSSSGTGIGSTKVSGIPSEFHDHLITRKQLLWAAREQASGIIKICSSLLEFEASRDGHFRIPGEASAGRAPDDGRVWQQVYFNALTRLDITFHSFTRAEHDWKLAQSSMEAATSGLFSATNELSIALVKAKSASGDIQGVLTSMRDSTYEAGGALSSFGRVTRGHTALTTECGSMLEEVLAITDGIPDIYGLGKEAATVHKALMVDLTKANSILLPLESMLVSDVAAMANVISRERESKLELPLVQGQALYQTYCLKLRESCQPLRSLVPSLLHSVKELLILVTNLARSASLHAGNLHKALEGLGESQDGRSQGIVLSSSKLGGHDIFSIDEDKNFIRNEGASGYTVDDDFCPEDEWVSPPDSIYSSSPRSGVTSTENATIGGTSDPSNSASSFIGGVHEILSSEKPETQQYMEALNDGISSLAITESTSPPNTSDSQLKPLSSQPDREYNLAEDISVNYESLGNKNEVVTTEQDNGRGGNSDDPPSNADPSSRVPRGKNSYALSVLRRVEMKLDGRDIDGDRQLDIAAHVDHLIRQATSIDNLCNMYEGWTPWI
ncbi:uncharacterized protein LOC18446022 isoform X1 [Amborella trichopoda]|uniref:non-specific serine/threonine protein kinase n=1 Tax=Amborella trichopoda TaxID=13333 RepID=U5D8D2_AMBTC|nr:uncharacterized protein LOC18446022 isoform X1 [Amborella trichopoda]XP_020530249.1 uncharacterized protein LOC18446022 isoform X1 [Amborella trichopoda]ERN17677.1 hypothetical protein AMTR_s00059p00199900 [Amborella trichopoda]|eukprot:XP_006856210.1 uncharacterized protein LOC18446022 isoform X1 [Amborella trichopoda]